MLRDQSLDLGLQLAKLVHQVLLVALIVAQLRGKASSQIVSLNFTVSELIV